MKITIFPVHLQLFSMQAHAVRRENSVHNSNGDRRDRSVFSFYGL